MKLSQSLYFLVLWYSGCINTVTYLSSKDAYTNYPNNGRAATRDVPVTMTVDIDDVCSVQYFFKINIEREREICNFFQFI